MDSYSQNITNRLTGKAYAEDTDEEQLKQLAAQYPYFGAAQFVVAKKTVADNNDDHLQHAQKAALFFKDALWLHFNLTITEDDLKNEPALNIDADDDQRFVIIKDGADELILVEPGSPQETTSQQEETVTTADEHTSARLSELLKQQAAEMNQPAEERLLIETIPLHRIDYFESQGIKLEPDKQENDKLGTQLKSFTAWLKQMKHINPDLKPMEPNEVEESAVKTIAEYSNESKEVITEAMAEILLKQGKQQEAINIYKKLSFSNPSKSAYFAAKIQDIKA